ncbi:MAG: DUF1877 family protein [Cyanobacteria bacterium P01_D01_bin.50]
MGIEAEFKQVSPYLLEKFKIYPDFIDLFFDAQYLPNSPFWQQYSIDLNDSEDSEWFNEAINYVPETLAKLKIEKLEDFKQLESDIPLIITEGKNVKFDIGKRWQVLHFILTGTDYSIPLPFLISTNEKDKLPSINIIFGGQTIDYETDYGLLRYLTVDEVKQIAQALSNFSRKQFHERLILKDLENNFEMVLNILYDDYQQLLNYYQNAADRHNAMFLYLC